MDEKKLIQTLRDYQQMDCYEKDELKHMLNGLKYHSILQEIQNRVFRPARKHGYMDKEIEKMIDDCGKDSEGYHIAIELIGKLEDEFLRILEEDNVDLWD